MSVPIEDLIREAQERQAERAYRPDRLLAELPARTARRARRRRHQTLGMVAAAVAVAATLTVPALRLQDNPNNPDGLPLQPGAQSSATIAGSPAGTATFPPVALRYSPTWLPSGFTERIRITLPGPVRNDRTYGIQRIWTNQPVGTNDAGGDTGVIMTLRQPVGTDDPRANTGVTVDINGKAGYYHGPQGDDKSSLEWRADTNTVVTLSEHFLNLSQQDMLRIARSIQPDPARMQVPLHLGWLPDGWSVTSGQVSGDSPTAWSARLTVEDQRTSDGTAAGASAGPSRPATNPGQGSISVFLSPTTTAPAGGQNLTVSGRPARLVARTDRPLSMQYLVVDLGHDKKLTVLGIAPKSNPMNDNDLIRVAEHATPSDSAEVAWIATP